MSGPRRVAVVTGTRADFGLLTPVITAIDAHPSLEAQVIVTGVHLLPPARTVDDVRAAFEVAATIPMQTAEATGRDADAKALGRGVSGFAELFGRIRPDVVLVLGDRIEAMAAALPAAVGGLHVAHLHGGDRAEGIADEGIRHAITKLAHVHLTASAAATERVIAMGEDPFRTHLVGSPAIDGLDAIEPLDDAAYEALGSPELLVLLHPTGASAELENEHATMLLQLCHATGPTLVLHPNHDPGREGIISAIEASGLPTRSHVPRATFIALLRRVKLVVGNSSAGIIECAAIPVRAVDIGTRQGGREKPRHVISAGDWDPVALRRAFERGRVEPMLQLKHPYGDGRAGPRVAEVLARVNSDNHPIVKRNTY